MICLRSVAFYLCTERRSQTQLSVQEYKRHIWLSPAGVVFLVGWRGDRARFLNSLCKRLAPLPPLEPIPEPIMGRVSAEEVHGALEEILGRDLPPPPPPRTPDRFGNFWPGPEDKALPPPQYPTKTPMAEKPLAPPSKPELTRTQEMVVAIVRISYPDWTTVSGAPNVTIIALTGLVATGWPGEVERRKIPKPHPRPPLRDAVARALRHKGMLAPAKPK
jgi:hypothetical protein